MTPPTRLERARALLADHQLDALVVSRTAGKRWLAGFVLMPTEESTSGYSGTLLITAERAVLLADARYTEQAAGDCPGWEVERTTDPLEVELAARLPELGVRRCGAEAESLTHGAWQRVADALPQVELVPIDEPLARLRLLKEPTEVEAIERACALTDACFDHLLGAIRPGMTERQVAWELEGWFRAKGAEGLAFDPLVLVGARAAMPHGRPGETQVTTGEPLLIDFGCQVDGYRSDMTRTVFIGDPSEDARTKYRLVLEAQQRAFETTGVGVIGSEVHGVALGHLAAQGLGEAFTHGLGHGIGLETHEAPRLKNSDQPLAVGMVFTLEPGVYLPGEIGIRIEDVVHLGVDGPRRLTHAPRGLTVL